MKATYEAKHEMEEETEEEEADASITSPDSRSFVKVCIVGKVKEWSQSRWSSATWSRM